MPLGVESTGTFDAEALSGEADREGAEEAAVDDVATDEVEEKEDVELDETDRAEPADVVVEKT